MRHLIMTGALVVVGLVVTFATATVLQNVALANRQTVYLPEPAPIIAERAKAPANKLKPEQSRQVILASARRAG
jgi:hypothetical protein